MRNHRDRPRRAVISLTATGLALALTATAAQAAHEARVAGEDRVETAVQISQATFAGADTVIVTRKDLFADALSASYLASWAGGPILLTDSLTLDAATEDEIERQFDAADANLRSGETAGEKTIYVLGGTAAVSPTVVGQLQTAFPDATVTRIGGDDRYDTNRMIIEAVGDEFIGTLGTSGRTALITRGDTFPDALSVGPVSYQASMPVVLTPGTSLPAATLQLLDDSGFEYAVVVGGPQAVSDDVRIQLEDLDIGMQRVAGDNREGTSVAVADFARTQLGFTQTVAVIGNSRNFPDALAGGPYGGVLEAPVLMVTNPTTLGEEVRGFLEAQAGSIETVIAVGGTAAVSEAVLDEASCTAQPEAAAC